MNRFHILAIAMLLGCALEARGEQSDGKFQTTITKQVGLSYRTITPANYDPLHKDPQQKDPQQKYPLLIFLHGRGEQGDDLDKVQIHGPFKKVAELGLPLIIVAPQSPLDESWEADSLSPLVDHLLETLPIDKTRVYLTGLSMGGQGTWRLSMRRPEVFSAIAPICGYGRPHHAELIHDTPVWIFHGEKDGTISQNESKRMAKSLEKVGNKAKLTIYPNVGHNSWTETYNNPEFYEWLLSHRKKLP